MSFACSNRKGHIQGKSITYHIPLLIIGVNKLLVNRCQVSKDCNSTESLESCIVVNVVAHPICLSIRTQCSYCIVVFPFFLNNFIPRFPIIVSLKGKIRKYNIKLFIRSPIERSRNPKIELKRDLDTFAKINHQNRR